MGDFEDDEDAYDVYKQESIDSYDFELGGVEQRDVRKALNKTYGFAGTDEDMLKMFAASKHKQQPPKVYAAPLVPADFEPQHRLERRSRFEPRRDGGAGGDDMSEYIRLSVSKRSEVLGEEPIRPQSVLDLVSASDRQFLQDQIVAATAQNEQQATTVPPQKPVSARTELEKKEKRYESFVSFAKKDYKGK